FGFDSRGVNTLRHAARQLLARLFGDHAISWLELVTVLFFMQLAEDAADFFAVCVFHIAKRKRARTRPQRHQTAQHSAVADTIHDKRFICGRTRATSLEIESD